MCTVDDALGTEHYLELIKCRLRVGKGTSRMTSEKRIHRSNSDQI
jgi:hypothetical protein